MTTYVERWTLTVDVAGERVEHPIAATLDAGLWLATSPVDDRTCGLASTRDADDAAAVAVVELVERLMRRPWAKGWRVLSIARRE